MKPLKMGDFQGRTVYLPEGISWKIPMELDDFYGFLGWKKPASLDDLGFSK